tara:strand:+ start:2786 stop:3022 length:237 start_codon:yes stop_codon:yes gene_type:complete
MVAPHLAIAATPRHQRVAAVEQKKNWQQLVSDPVAICRKSPKPPPPKRPQRPPNGAVIITCEVEVAAFFIPESKKRSC